MNTVLVTVSDDRFGRKDGRYEITQKKIENLFKNNSHFGISSCRMWTVSDIIETDFYKKDPTSLINNPDPSINGRVYKPLSILETLKTLNDGDFLIYSDCSPEMWDMREDFIILPKEYKLDVIKNLCITNGGILTAHVKWNHTTHVNKGEIGFHTHENFTTDLCMTKMGLTDFKYSMQHASGMIVLQKSKRSLDFLEEWLYWNSIEECAAWYNEGLGKIGHRHDQSISGLLINKMGNNIIETLDWYERNPGESPYLFLNFCKPEYKYNFFKSNQPMRNVQFKMVGPDIEITNR